MTGFLQRALPDTHRPADTRRPTFTPTGSGRPMLPVQWLNDAEYASALRLLDELDDPRAWAHVSVSGFDFTGMIEATSWSSSQAMLIRAAAALFSGSLECDLRRITWCFDKRQTQALLEALAIRFNLPVVPVGEAL